MHKLPKKIYVLSLIGSNLVEVECVTKLLYSSWKDYAIRWTYTTDKSQIDALKARLIGA